MKKLSKRQVWKLMADGYRDRKVERIFMCLWIAELHRTGQIGLRTRQALLRPINKALHLSGDFHALFHPDDYRSRQAFCLRQWKRLTKRKTSC